jgi:hypothetical protein
MKISAAILTFIPMSFDGDALLPIQRPPGSVAAKTDFR